jgi:hypothetical protein
MEQLVEGAAPIVLRHLALVGAAIFDEDGLRLVAAPADGVALVRRMQRVNHHDQTAERQARGQCALAEAGQHHGLLGAGKAGLGDPGGKVVELQTIHRP